MNNQAQKEKSETSKSPGKFQVFLLIFLIPAIFLSFASLVVLTMLDINLFEKAEEAGITIPFISKDEEEIPVAETENPDQKIVNLQASIEEKEDEISVLLSEIDTKQEENEQLIAEQESLLSEMENLSQLKETESKEFNEIVSVFEEMSGKTSAPVILEMTDSEAVKILAQLSSDSLAAVFEEMAPVDAARYTELLASRTP